MKKFIVIPFGYEYNDNTYDREGFQFDEARHFDTAKEANAERLKMTEKRIPELNDNYSSVLYCMDWTGRKAVIECLGIENDYEYQLDLSELPEEQKNKVLELVAPYVYEITEIDSDKDCTKITFEGDSYSTESYSVKLGEDGKVIMHSLTEPAYMKTYKDEYSHWMDDGEEEDEYYKKYYIDGVQVTKEKWRESKIDSVIEKEF